MMQNTSLIHSGRLTAVFVVFAAGLAGVVTPTSGQVIDEEQKLLASDGGVADWFGKSVSVSGKTAVVGASGTDENGPESGSAYVFEKAGDVWVQQAKLLSSDGVSNDQFGYAVAVSGETTVVGAYWDEDLGFGSGSVYVFEKVGGIWVQQAKLLAADGVEHALFGWAVFVKDNTIVIGAPKDGSTDDRPGAAYVFEKTGDTWVQQAKLLAADGEANDKFGYAVSVSGNTVVVGARWDDDLGTNSGSAYVFEKAGGVWTQQAKLLAADGAAEDMFGIAVAVDGETVVVGAAYDDDLTTNSGSVYIFEKTGDTWTQQVKLHASDPSSSAFFGWSVAMDSGTVVVGARWADNDVGDKSGAAYVFAKTEGLWAQQAKLLSSDGVSNDRFGYAVAVSGETTVVGAYWDEDFGFGSGSAYVFDIGGIGCPADLNGDGVVDTRDFIDFLSAWAESDPLADWNEDGTIDTRDFIAFLSDWSAGCP